MNDPTGFVASERAVGMKYMLEDPIPKDNIGTPTEEVHGTVYCSQEEHDACPP